jgi:pyrimidine operon attenuation protein / uracil phosphoribosyltransferase
MEKRLLLNSFQLQLTIDRLCQQLIENYSDFSETVVLGLQPRGVFLAERVRSNLEKLISRNIPFGFLDVTFHRDDFRKRDFPLIAHENRIPFILDDKNVILIDDVLYTGRTVRAALDAMIAYGRPRKVELLVLIDRRYTRDLPIQADYTGRQVDTLQSQKVLVELKEQGVIEDNIWIINKK